MDSTEVPKELFEKKQKQRAALRAEYWKQITNPHRHGTGEGGFLFDPAIQRYMSHKVAMYNYFKPTPKTSFWGFLVFILPLGGMMYYFKTSRDKDEELYRTGQISYRDRNFKFC
uniref:NADH dehydrogenase [ubiquinone] 1 beta subcomplex subunit 4 n=1 Tax=Clastoptera arizonana TaxID=38151 RepID=A0A1B6D6E1_9HEMI